MAERNDAGCRFFSLFETCTERPFSLDSGITNYIKYIDLYIVSVRSSRTQRELYLEKMQAQRPSNP